ncbi:uncharacterized protein LOC131325976 [Rhododendron vialii]|uniref:uncharacterized protein LOC131325976 n=1 Tax=Rhododendron vialii TaxID=182163 RepID=UPI0026602BED|nr:uncharacterized protein LOC131325976 [Rhododendron vialii]
MACSSNSGTPSPLRIRLCDHGKEAVVHTSWTDKNSGRRFFCCPFWVPGAPKRNGPHCNYFEWLDGEIGEQEKVARRSESNTRSLHKCIEEYERMMGEYESKMVEREFKCKEQEDKCKEYERKMKEIEKKINDLEVKVWKSTEMMWGAWVACSILVVIIFAIISTGRGFEKKYLGRPR